MENEQWLIHACCRAKGQGGSFLFIKSQENKGGMLYVIRAPHPARRPRTLLIPIIHINLPSRLAKNFLGYTSARYMVSSYHMDKKKTQPRKKRAVVDKEVPFNYYKPGTVEKGQFDLTEHYAFTRDQFKYLQSYSLDLDESRAMKDIGVTPSKLKKWKSEEGFLAELSVIHDVYRKAIRMTSNHAAAKLLDLMDKFEGDYDQMDHSDKSKMAQSLMKGADSYLKATGQYANEKDVSGNNITINIDLSGELKPRVVDAEVIDNDDGVIDV